MTGAVIIVTMYTHTEVVAALTQELGAPIAWGAWLQDHRRPSRSDNRPKTFFGLVLLPSGATNDSRRLPLYRIDEVNDFIERIKAADPGLTVRPKGKKYQVEMMYSTFDPTLAWRYHRAAAV